MTLPASRRGRLPFVLACACLVLAGCSVSQQLTVRPDGSGEADLTIDVHPILVAYLDDIAAAVTGIPGEYPVFDVVQIAEAVGRQPGLELRSLELAGRGRLLMTVSFTNVAEAAAAAGGTGVVTLQSRGAERELRVNLDREAVNWFLSFTPPESAAVTQLLFPPADGSVSAAAYRDELAWALEEYADRSTVTRMLDAATLDVTVTPTSRLIGQTGGTVESGTVVFRIPVLELLTLRSPRTYSVRFGS